MKNESWPPEAVSLLEGGIERHGGFQAWRRIRQISLAPTRLWGALPWLKGVGRTFPLPARIEVFPHERRTVFHGYPRRGMRGIFDRGATRIESVEDGRVLQALSDPQRTFGGLSKNRRWTPMDAL